MLQRSSDEGDERMSAVIAEIEKEEVNEIERCFERLNSLRELALAFESDEIFNKKSDMYQKMLDDTTQTRKRFDMWWDKIIEKYNLQDHKREEMRVDFLSQEIILVKLAENCQV